MVSSWKEYIDKLPDFPSGAAAWEDEFIFSVSHILPKGEIKNALEVGCSNGRFLKWLRSIYGCELYGLDSEPSGFSKGGLIEFSVGDARKLPYPDNTFDLVLSLGLLEHFKKSADKTIVLREQARVLKKGGYLVCQVPILSLSLNYIYTKVFYDLRKGTRHFRLTERELRKYFSGLGLEIKLLKHVGYLLESGLFAALRKKDFLKRHLATEILVIAKK